MNAKRAYLLAAGRGSRAGGPKAWSPSDGGTLLERQLAFLSGLFSPEEVWVTIQAEWRERCAALSPKSRWVAEDPDAPVMAALAALLMASPADGWASLHHVDMPVWERALFEALDGRIPEAERGSAEAIVPSHGGRKGHPVFLSPAAQRALRAADPAKDRLDLWLRARKVLVVELPQAVILENRNSPPVRG